MGSSVASADLSSALSRTLHPTPGLQDTCHDADCADGAGLRPARGGLHGRASGETRRAYGKRANERLDALHAVHLGARRRFGGHGAVAVIATMHRVAAAGGASVCECWAYEWYGTGFDSLYGLRLRDHRDRSADIAWYEHLTAVSGHFLGTRDADIA